MAVSAADSSKLSVDDEAKKKEEEEQFLAEAKEAAVEAAKSADLIPAEFNALPSNIKDLAEAACFHAYVAGRTTVKSCDVEMGTLTMSAPAELIKVLTDNGVTPKVGDTKTPSEQLKARHDAVAAAYAKLPTGQRELKNEVREWPISISPYLIDPFRVHIVPFPLLTHRMHALFHARPLSSFPLLASSSSNWPRTRSSTCSR